MVQSEKCKVIFNFRSLPTAHGQLPTDNCLLPTAYCLLPTAY